MVWPFSKRLALSDASNNVAKSSSGSVTGLPPVWLLNAPQQGYEGA
jgi:hypothetical protein